MSLWLQNRHIWRVEAYLHSFSTSALDGGKGSAYRAGSFTPREIIAALISQEAGWAPEPVWTFWKRY